MAGPSGGLPPRRSLPYGPGMSVTRPQDLIDRPVPALALPGTLGGTFALRSRVGVGALVLFFYVRNGTPG